MLNGVPKCHQGRTMHSAVRMLWKSCTSRSSAEMYLRLTIPCQLIWWSMANIATHSCRIRWGQQFTANNQNCWSIVSFCSRTMQHLIKITMRKSVQCWGREVLAQPPYFSDPAQCDDWLFDMWKNIFGRNSVNQKTISTLLSLPLYIVWARMNIELQLIMYHIDGISMWTVLVITLRRVHACKHSGISVVLLSCILY
jgi:hypothetical protein